MGPTERRSVGRQEERINREETVNHLQSRLKVYASFVLLQKVMQETVGQNKHDSAELKKQTVSTLWKYVQEVKRKTGEMS